MELKFLDVFFVFLLDHFYLTLLFLLQEVDVFQQVLLGHLIFRNDVDRNFLLFYFDVFLNVEFYQRGGVGFFYDECVQKKVFGR